MADKKCGTDEERRADVRLASGKKVDAVVVDRHGQPITLLREAEVLNISGGGLSLVSTDPVDAGDHVNINLPETSKLQRRVIGAIKLGVLSCLPCDGNKHKIRCKLIDGGIPTNLIYGW